MTPDDTPPDPLAALFEELRTLVAFLGTYDEDDHPQASNEAKRRAAAVLLHVADALAATLDARPSGDNPKTTEHPTQSIVYLHARPSGDEALRAAIESLARFGMAGDLNNRHMEWRSDGEYVRLLDLRAALAAPVSPAPLDVERLARAMRAAGIRPDEWNEARADNIAREYAALTPEKETP